MSVDLREWPVLVPTSAGPAGAIVTEPQGEQRAALVLLAGAGQAGRSGVNGMWARAARLAASELGAVVFRCDYPGVRDSYMLHGRWGAEHLRVVTEAVDWFRDRFQRHDLMLAGSCYGGRLAAELAAEIEGVKALGLITPYVDAAAERLAAPLAEASRVEQAAATLGRVLARVPVSVLAGERDGEDLRLLRAALPEEAHSLEVEMVADVALHNFRSAAAQRAAIEWIVHWLSKALVPAQAA